MRSIRVEMPAPAVLLGATIATGVAVWISVALARPDGSISYIWLGNAVQLAALLLLPRRQWPVLLTAFFVVQMLVLVPYGGTPFWGAFFGVVANTVEVLLAAFVLAPDRDWVEGHTDRLRSWLWFGLWGLLIAPAVGALLGAAALVPWTLPPSVLFGIWLQWYVTDALALAVVVPLILRLRPRGLRQLRQSGNLVRFGLGMVALVLISLLVFWNASFLLLFLVPLPLVVLLFRSGFAGLSMGMAVLVVIALSLTGAGRGPLQAVAGGDPTTALLPCQFFLITVFVLMVVIAALLDERQRQAVLETASFEVYGLLATLSGDIVVVFEPGGWLLYCTPTVGELLGVQDEAMRGTGWLELVHPDDAETARRLIQDVGPLGPVEGTFRMRHADGSWRWFAVQLRRSGGGAALDFLVVGLIRDVSDQRELEESLRSRANALSSIAYVDPLTGLDNRRRLAEQQDQLWADAARRHEPLSLLVIDIDRFKTYNDDLGHLAGDEALSRVARAIAGAIRRPTDTCGRFGGEEFVALLPATDQAGAGQVAEQIRAAVQDLAIAHAASDLGIVTVSIGCSTWEPATGAPAEDRRSAGGPPPTGDLNGADELFRTADAALYQAKAAGRNRVAAMPLESGGRFAAMLER